MVLEEKRKKTDRKKAKERPSLLGRLNAVNTTEYGLVEEDIEPTVKKLISHPVQCFVINLKISNPESLGLKG